MRLISFCGMAGVGPEPDFRWTAANDALIVFELEKPVDLVLKIQAEPFLVPGRVERQELRVSLNGKFLTTLVLNEQREYDLSLPLQLSDLRQKNVLTLTLPNATSPRSLGLSDDSRHLGIAVHSISFEQPLRNRERTGVPERAARLGWWMRPVVDSK